MEIVPFLIYLQVQLLVIAQSLVVNSTMKLSKQDWKIEQQADLDIGPIITLINNKALLQYVAKEGNPSGMRVLLKYQNNLNDERRITI